MANTSTFNSSTQAWFEQTPSDPVNGKGSPQSPYNASRSFECGHYEEYDSTPGNERIRVQHNSGSFKEYQAGGNVVHKIIGDGYHIVMQNQNVSIQGKCSITIMSDLELHVGGNMHLIVDGDFTKTVKGNHDSTVKGDHTHNVEGTHQSTATSTVHQAVEDLTVSGNLNVRGDVLCQQTVSAVGSLTAGGHLHVQGSVMAEGLMTKVGGKAEPHVFGGICPELGFTVDVVGPVDITTAEAVAVVSTFETSVDAGGELLLQSGAATVVDAVGAVTVTGATISLN